MITRQSVVFCFVNESCSCKCEWNKLYIVNNNEQGMTYHKLLHLFLYVRDLSVGKFCTTYLSCFRFWNTNKNNTNTKSWVIQIRCFTPAMGLEHFKQSVNNRSIPNVLKLNRIIQSGNCWSLKLIQNTINPPYISIQWVPSKKKTAASLSLLQSTKN